MRAPTMRTGLRADIETCGYFPDLVEDAIVVAVGDEELRAFLVHHEPTFDRDEIHRHITILALTPTRLVVGHTDDHPPEENMPGTYAATSTEAIPLRMINTVVLTRVVAQPQDYRTSASTHPADAVVETWLTVGWGAVRRVDLEPATCGDPDCEADHGYTGTLAGDDLTVRMSTAADGADRVAKLVSFTTTLQQATAV